MKVEYRWVGDQHVLMLIGEAVKLETVVRVVDLNRRLLNSDLSPLIIETVPTWCAILIHFNLARVRPRDFTSALDDFLGRVPQTSTLDLNSRLVTLPVLYGGAVGPDLEMVAAVNHVSTTEAVRRLAEGTHLVGMISFIPGQANCMWVEPELALSAPKYAQPRTYTPEGTVGLGGSSIALYSVASPGGFQMVGRMPVPTYSPYPILRAFERSPILLRVGDRLRLKSIDREEFDTVLQLVREGRYDYEIEESTLAVNLVSS